MAIKKKMAVINRVNEKYNAKAGKYTETQEKGVMNLKSLDCKINNVSSLAFNDLSEHTKCEEILLEGKKIIEQNIKKTKNKLEGFKKVEDKIISKNIEKQDIKSTKEFIRNQTLYLLEVKKERETMEGQMKMLMTAAKTNNVRELLEKAHNVYYKSIYNLSTEISSKKYELEILKSELNAMKEVNIICLDHKKLTKLHDNNSIILSDTIKKSNAILIMESSIRALYSKVYTKLPEYSHPLFSHTINPVSYTHLTLPTKRIV